MKKIFYLSTALILCGMAQSQASCIQTPSCTSLGYTKTSSCTNGLKCPFGNYWYCPSSGSSSGGSGSGTGAGESSLCSSCNVGDFICSSGCSTLSKPQSLSTLGGDCSSYVISKSGNTCTRISTPYGTKERFTLEKFIQEATFYDWYAVFSVDSSSYQALCQALGGDIGDNFISYALISRGSSSQLQLSVKYNCGSALRNTTLITSCSGSDLQSCLSNVYNFPEDYYIPVVSTF